MKRTCDYCNNEFDNAPSRITTDYYKTEIACFCSPECRDKWIKENYPDFESMQAMSDNLKKILPEGVGSDLDVDRDKLNKIDEDK